MGTKIGSIVMVAVLVVGTAAFARPGRLMADDDIGGHGGVYTNLIVREMTVEPVRAVVGEKVKVDVLIEFRGEGMGSAPLRLWAGKNIVDQMLYDFRAGMESERLRRFTLEWDTKGAAPGEHRLRVELFNPTDAHEFDNELALPEPVVVAAPGASFPGGIAAGGRAKAIQER